MSIVVNRQDPRFETLKKGHNTRFPATPADTAARVELCTTADEAHEALQRIVSAGMRPTLRSGGHCYEDFVANNPGGAILDMSLMDTVDAEPQTGVYRIAPGAMLGDVYQSLYKRFGLTLPAGTCYMVGSGGHISGGGYGLLSRLNGLTVDWITAIDILTVNQDGAVVPRRVSRHTDPDLFRACRGAGGGNFGVITGFRFDKLPRAPLQVAEATLGFDWANMTQDQFTRLLVTFGSYWETRGRDADTWGLFADLVVGARRPNGRLGIHAQFCQPDGTVNDLSVLHEFFARFDSLNPVVMLSSRQNTGQSAPQAQQRDTSAHPAPSPYSVVTRPWLDATLAGGASGGGIRAKYKSSYMKRTFTSAEAQILYRYFSSGDPGAESSVVSIDSYGGAINRPDLARETSIAQRSSVMKLQWQSYWREAGQDAERLKSVDDFFTAVYTGDHVDADHQGTPWGDRYEGCYMNYADAAMLQYPYWPQLFFGRGELYGFLQGVKRRYDPNNVFHHAMSIRT